MVNVNVHTPLNEPEHQPKNAHGNNSVEVQFESLGGGLSGTWVGWSPVAGILTQPLDSTGGEFNWADLLSYIEDCSENTGCEVQKGITKAWSDSSKSQGW